MPNSKSSKSSVTPSNLGKRRASEVSKSQEFLLESASAKLFDSINIATDGEKTIPFAEVSDLEKPQAILFNALSSTAEEGVAEVQPLMSIAELKSSYEGFLTKDLQLPSNDFEKTDLSIEVFTASSAQEQKKEGGVEARFGGNGVSASRLLDDSSRGPR